MRPDCKQQVTRTTRPAAGPGPKPPTHSSAARELLKAAENKYDRAMERLDVAGLALVAALRLPA